MEVVLLIQDETPRGELIQSVRVTLSKEKLSLREFVRTRVQQEVERFNLQRPVCFKALVRPEDAQETTQGFRLSQHRDLDWERQAEEAISALESKSFFVTLDGKEVSSLDEEMSLNSGSDLRFVILMPVVGG